MIRTNSRQGGKYYTRYLAYQAKKNYILLLLSAVFLVGVAFGAWILRSAGGDTVDLLLRVVQGFVEKRREQTLWQNLFSSVSSSFVFVAVLFVCGFCAISQPVILLVPLFRGLGFGFSVASLYSNYGAKAIGFVALFMLPDMLISSLAILLCCRESIRLSHNFWNLMRSNAENESYPVRVYMGRYIAASALCIFSAFLEAVLYLVFSNNLILI